MPFEKIDLSPPPRPRPFSPTMQASGLAKGVIVAAKSVVVTYATDALYLGDAVELR